MKSPGGGPKPDEPPGETRPADTTAIVIVICVRRPPRSRVLLAAPAHQKTATDERDDQCNDAYPLHNTPS
jgi:hypothetical protein